MVGIPVRSRGLQGLHRRKSSSAFVAQSVDIPVPSGIPHLDPGSAASSAVSRDEAFQRSFRTFPRVQHSYEGEEPLSSLESESEEEDPGGRFNSLEGGTRGHLLGGARFGLGGFLGSDMELLEVSVVLASVSFWSTSYSEASAAAAGILARRCVTTGAGAGVLAEPEAIDMAVYGGFQKNFLSWVLARAVRTWKFGALFPHVLVSSSHASCFWVLHVEH